MNEMILIGSIAVYPDRIKAIANDIYVGGRPDAPKEKSVTIEYNDGTKYQAHGIDIKEVIEILNEYNEKMYEKIKKSAEKVAEMFEKMSEQKGSMSIYETELIQILKGIQGHEKILEKLINYFDAKGYIEIAKEICRRMTIEGN